MANKHLFGVDPVNGRSKWTFVDHTGPTSYAPFTAPLTGGDQLGQSSFGGPNVLGLSDYQFVSSCLTNSGNYQVNCVYGGTGSRQKVFLIWSYSGLNGQGALVTQNVAGVGMTPGTVVPIVFAGGTGSGAAGSVTVLTATTISINVTNPGTYTVAPTATISGTGGTPATLTVSLSTTGLQVTAGTNLSTETVRILAIGG